MRTLILACLLAVQGICNAQSDTTRINFMQPSIQDIDTRMQTAGEHLVRYQGQYMYGVMLSVAGMAFATTPLYFEWENPIVPIAAGGVLTLAAIITIVDANRHVKRAGIALQGNSIVIPINQ